MGRAQQRGAQVGRGFDLDDGGARRQGDLDVRGDDRHPCPAVERGRGDRGAHLPGRAVADVADRIDGLARAACGHDDVAAGEVGITGRFDERWTGRGIRCTDRAIGNGRHHGFDDGRQLRQPPDARLARRERSRVRLDYGVPELAQPGDVRDSRGMAPHVAIHRGCDDDRGGGSKGRCGHHVTGQSAGHRTEPVGGRRRHDDRVGRVGDDDVADPSVGEEIEHLDLDRVARERGE